jgi:hypothetical protein
VGWGVNLSSDKQNMVVRKHPRTEDSAGSYEFLSHEVHKMNIQ